MRGEPGSLSVAITGASGVRVGLRFLKVARGEGFRVEGVIVTRGAVKVAVYEDGYEEGEFIRELSGLAPVYMEDDMGSPLASSSSQPDSMVIVPASMKTISLIANGIPSSLVSRAALSILRLGRKLVVVPRETPLGIAELRNLLAISRMGAIVLPMAPGFYSNPKSVDDIVDFIVGKIFDVLGHRVELYERWRGAPPED